MFLCPLQYAEAAIHHHPRGKRWYHSPEAAGWPLLYQEVLHSAVARRPHERESICQLQVIADVANDFVGTFEERTSIFRLGFSFVCTCGCLT